MTSDYRKIGYDQNAILAEQGLRAMNYVGVASYTLLIYDHLLTFSDEVRYIWKGHRGPLIWLFFINRYFAPTAYAINLIAYTSPSWSPELCMRFITYEGVIPLFVLAVSHIMMILRIRALYYKTWIPVIVLAVFLITEVSVVCWLISVSEPDAVPSGMSQCGAVFPPSTRIWTATTSWLPIIFETLVLGLTLRRTLNLATSRYASGIVRCLVRDGIIYYFAVLAVALAYVMMYILAREDVKAILGPLASLLIVTMMSRITLNLRQQAMETQVISGDGLTTAAFTASVESSVAFDLAFAPALAHALDPTTGLPQAAPGWSTQGADPFARMSTQGTGHGYEWEPSGAGDEDAARSNHQHERLGSGSTATGTGEEGSGGTFELRDFKRRSRQSGEDEGDDGVN